MDFQNIESLRKYFLRVDSHFHRENKLCNIESKSLYTYSNLFIRKVSLKASLKVNSHRLFSRQAIEVAHKRKVTYAQEATLKKMTPSVLKEASLDYGKITPLDEKATPLKLNKAASSKSDKKVYQEHGYKPSLDQEKATPLEVAHIDIYEDTPKLDAEYIVLLKLKRLGRVRHSRYKAQIYKYGLALDI